MEQLLATEQGDRLEEIAKTLVAILTELRTANRRERERDDKKDAEKTSREEKYARL